MQLDGEEKENVSVEMISGSAHVNINYVVGLPSELVRKLLKLDAPNKHSESWLPVRLPMRPQSAWAPRLMNIDGWEQDRTSGVPNMVQQKVTLKPGETQTVSIDPADGRDASLATSRSPHFSTPEALMKHAAQCQTEGDSPGFMACWTEQPFKDLVPSYLLTSVMQLQYSENAPPGDKPRHPEQLVELKQILTEEFGGKEAGRSLLALAMAHKEIADQADDKFAEAAEGTAKSPLVQLLASGTTSHIDPRSFVMKIAALHAKYGEPDAKKEPRVFAYKVEQDGDTAVATETTGNNKFGLIKTEAGWRINDLWYGMKPQDESADLQGIWEFISVESDGVVTEYKALETQPSLARLTITGDMWMVKAGDGSISSDLGSGGHRVRIDGNKLTFNGTTTSMPGSGSSNEISTIGYGLFKLDGDSLVYLTTPAVAGGELIEQSEPAVKFPESFETKGTENNVFRLRRVGEQESAFLDPNSSNTAPASKSSPEIPPVKILVHDEEGKPLKGVQVSLLQAPVKQGGQILEISETSDGQGMAVNRNLPFGHYELSAKTADGWYLPGNGSKINIEFEKGLDFTLVAPTPVPVSKLRIRDDVKSQLASVSELRFGILEEVNGPAFWVTGAPEPEADIGDYGNFPTLTNGIEHVGVEIRFEIAKSISQPSRFASHLNTKWQWSPVDETNSSRRYLIVNGQARGFVNGRAFDDKGLHVRPLDDSKLFQLPSSKHRVGASLFALREPTALPLELAIPAGEINLYVERFLGKPNAAAMKALNWQAQDNQQELWLEANVQRNSAWIGRLVDTTGWIPTILKPGYNEIAGHLQIRKSIQAGETLEISLSTQKVNTKQMNPIKARTLDDVTLTYNEQTKQLRRELFNPPIPDLTKEQMQAAMIDAAQHYRKQGKVEIASALKTSAESNRLADPLAFLGMSGSMSDGFRQITPTFLFEVSSNARASIVLSNAELRYSRKGWSSKTWGDIHPPITGKWELVSVEEHGEALAEDAFNEWRLKHANWTNLVIDEKSLTMAGVKAMPFDFAIDHDSGLLDEFRISHDGDTKFEGVLMGNGFIDDTTLVFAVDIEGRSKPKTFDTKEGKTTNLTFRRAGEAAMQSKASLKTDSSSGENGPLSIPDGSMQVFFKQPLNARVILTKGNNRQLVHPRRVNLPFGETHYFELSDFPEYTGIHLSGSIALKKVSKEAEEYLQRNAVPIEITKDDIERCLKSQVVIKVAYVPNPAFPGASFGAPEVLDSPLRTEGELSSEAEQRGATMAVLRLYKSITAEGKKNVATDESGRQGTTEEILKFFQGHPKATDRTKKAFEVAAAAAMRDNRPLNTLYLLTALMRDGSAQAINGVAEQKKIAIKELIQRCDDSARVTDAASSAVE